MIAALAFLIATSRQAPGTQYVVHHGDPYARQIGFKPGFNLSTPRFWVDQLIEEQGGPARGNTAWVVTPSSLTLTNELFQALDNDLALTLESDPDNTAVSHSARDQFFKAMLFWAMGSGRYWGKKDYVRLSLVADTAFEECLTAKAKPLSPSLHRLAELARALNMRVFNGPRAEARVKELCQLWEHDYPEQALVANMRLAEIYWFTNRRSEAEQQAENARKRFESLKAMRIYAHVPMNGFWRRDSFFQDYSGDQGMQLHSVLQNDVMTQLAIGHHPTAVTIEDPVFSSVWSGTIWEEGWDSVGGLPKHLDELARLSEDPDLDKYMIFDRRTARFFPRESGFVEVPLTDPVAIEAAKDLAYYGGTLLRLSVRPRPYWISESKQADREEAGVDLMAFAKVQDQEQAVKVYGQKIEGDTLWNAWPKYVLPRDAED